MIEFAPGQFFVLEPMDFGPIDPPPFPPDSVDPDSDHEHVWACTPTCLRCDRPYDGRFDHLYR